LSRTPVFRRHQENSLEVEKTGYEITYLDTDTGLAGGVYEIPVGQFFTEVLTDGAGENFIVELPSCHEVMGDIYLIYMTARDTTDVTIRDRNNDTDIGIFAAAGTAVLDAADEWIALISSGRGWHALAGVYT